MTEQILEEIYETVADNTHLKNYYTMMGNYQKQLFELNKQMDDDRAQILRQMEERTHTHQMIKNIHAIRQCLNILFNKLWSIHKNNIQTDTDFVVLANNITILKRKERVNESDGLKYAVCVLSKLCVGQIDICEFYIKLNELYHPKIKPIQTMYKNIADLKIKLDEYKPHFLKEIDITPILLDNLNNEIKTYEHLFV